MGISEKEAIDTLKNCIADYVIGEYCSRCGDFQICESRNEDCYYLQAIETVLNLLEKKDIDIIEAKEANRQLSVELQKKDKIIDEIQKEVRDHIGFENRLKRDNREPDLFNQGRFYVANNINNIMKGK